MESQHAPPCDGPDLQSEGVYLQYNIGAGWQTIFYFSPIGFPYTGWQNHCFVIPALAQTPTTQFRWSQTTISSPVYDQWGIDNVNIGTCSGYTSLWSGPGITGLTGNSVYVSPTSDSTSYSLMYSNWIDDTCNATIAIYANQPTVSTSITPASCTGSDTLSAQGNIIANCEYNVRLYNYLPGGTSQNGWAG